MLALNGIKISPTIFPDKTSQVWKVPGIKRDDNIITWVFESESEFLHLAQLVALLPTEPVVNIPYFPYGRQDKKISNESTFALEPFCRLLETLEIFEINTFDLHSQLATDLVPQLINHSADELITNILKEGEYDYLCFPDEGATKRYLISGYPWIVGKKQRDQLTGKIEKYNVDVELELGSTTLVVDDICDGGMTFIMLGEELKKKGIIADLYVSHGIFSKGLDILKLYYRRIITTNSLPINHKELTVYESSAPHRLLQSGSSFTVSEGY